MAVATRISNAAAIAACDEIVDLIDVGSSNANGQIKVYDGTQPANPDVAVSSQNLLATLELSAPAFGAAADDNPGGKATASSITSDSSIDLTGTAAWFRVLDRDGTAIMDGSVGTSSADMILDSVALTAGETLSITSWTVTMPET